MIIRRGQPLAHAVHDSIHAARAGSIMDALYRSVRQMVDYAENGTEDGVSAMPGMSII